MPFDAEGNFTPATGEVNTKPTIVLPEQVLVRVSELAEELANAQQQGYVESNVLIRLLELAKMILPMVLGV